MDSSHTLQLNCTTLPIRTAHAPKYLKSSFTRVPSMLPPSCVWHRAHAVRAAPQVSRGLPSALAVSMTSPRAAVARVEALEVVEGALPTITRTAS